MTSKKVIKNNIFSHFLASKSTCQHYKHFCLQIMFLIGLEIDVPYVSCTFRQASILAYGSFIMCCVLATGVSQLIYPHIHAITRSRVLLTLTLMLLTANATSPLVIKMTTEMKLTTSEVGQLAISASLVNDISCFHLLALKSTWKMVSDGD